MNQYIKTANFLKPSVNQKTNFQKSTKITFFRDRIYHLLINLNQSIMQMRLPKDPFQRSFSIERRPQLPVKALSEKLKPTQNCKTQYFVQCISSQPLANNTTKEEMRMNYISNVIQGKHNNDKNLNFNQSVGLPRLPMSINASSLSTSGMAPSQVSMNPFIKSFSGSPYQSVGQSSNAPIPLGLPASQQKNIQQNKNSSMAFHNNNFQNPFMTGNKQLQNNLSSNNNPSMTSFVTSSFNKQTSFAAGLGSEPGQVSGVFGGGQGQQGTGVQQGAQQNNIQGMFGNQVSAGDTFGGLSGQPNPLATNQHAPGQLTTSPSFGVLNQSSEPMLTTFGKANIQPQSTIFGSKPTTSTLTSQPTTSFQASNTFAPLTPPNPQVNVLSQHNDPSPMSKLDQNIQDLLQSKPNLWNILSLDPQYRHGYNQCGRMYVKSVLQRIIDQNILSEDSLNKIIIEIYKQMHGRENFQRILEKRKKEMLHYEDDDKIAEWKISDLLGKQFGMRKAAEQQSVFPKDIDSIGEDFYRSFKRRSTKLIDEPYISSIKSDKQQNEYEQRLARKYYQVNRKPTRSFELQVKFVQVNRPQEKVTTIESPFTSEKLDKIAETIGEIRAEHRRQIMPKQNELPDIEGFTISPTLQQIRKYTRYQLQSVPKVSISNQWGSLRFKAPISLLNKKLTDCIIINQKSVQIIDQQWKVRDAEITFKKFADFTQLDQNDQEDLENRIIAWCEKENLELLNIDREKGQVVIEI